MGNKKRISVSVFLFIGVFLASFYFTFIHHPPAAEILANQGEQPSSSVDEFNLDPNVEHSMADISKAAWGKFLYMNKYVAIGDVFDTDCEDPQKILVGKIIILKDEDTGGIKVRGYTNTSFDATIIYGITHILVHYNGKVLYDNGLDLCTVEEGDEEQVMPCPISKGAHYYVKELKISSLLPKGEYKVKTWMSNQDKKTVLCSTTTLKL